MRFAHERPITVITVWDRKIKNRTFVQAGLIIPRRWRVNRPSSGLRRLNPLDVEVLTACEGKPVKAHGMPGFPETQRAGGNKSGRRDRVRKGGSGYRRRFPY